MDKFLEGIVEFQRKDFEEHKELFKKISKKQDPHTLFIGCSDSRVVPSMITNTLPGELFIVRNIANIVPPYRKTEEYVSTTSAVEYAVEVLNVENIVVCGHSNCGGCAGLYKPDSFFDNIPHVKKWLELSKPLVGEVEKQLPGASVEEKKWLIEQMNIVEQLKHLFSYPFIKEKYKKRELNIYGWYYIIETGEIYNYNRDNKRFELIAK